MIEMTVESVRMNISTQQRVVILKARDQERYLFLWIAHPEAYAIAAELQHISNPRPLTHDLMCQVIETTGMTITRVEITRVVEDIFYSNIHLERDGQPFVFDARPSDALALAVRTHAPIYVSEQVLQRSGMSREKVQEKIPHSETTMQFPPDFKL